MVPRQPPDVPLRLEFDPYTDPGPSGPRKGEYRALRELGTLALATLSGDPETNPIVLQNILRLLRFERTFTPIFARYLGERDDAAMVLDAFDKLLKSRAYLNGWQAWWLEHTVAKLKQFKAGSGAARRLKWVLARKESSGSSATLNAYALLTLARHSATTAEEVLMTYDRTIESARTDSCCRSCPT